MAKDVAGSGEPAAEGMSAEIDAAYRHWQSGRHGRSTAEVAADLSEGALAAISEQFEWAFRTMRLAEERLRERRGQLNVRAADFEQRDRLIAERERWVQEHEAALRWREEHVWVNAERGLSGPSVSRDAERGLRWGEWRQV